MGREVRAFAADIDRGWDVTADGERFLFTEDLAPRTETAVDLTLIQNWDDELKRLIPRDSAAEPRR